MLSTDFQTHRKRRPGRRHLAGLLLNARGRLAPLEKLRIGELVCSLALSRLVAFSLRSREIELVRTEPDFYSGAAPACFPSELFATRFDNFTRFQS